MNGLVYTINKLGETLAAAEQALVQAEQENTMLRARVEELESKPKSTPKPKAP